MKYYYFTIDGGDGSANVRWIAEDKLDKLQQLVEDDTEGFWYVSESLDSITVPDGTTPEDLGIRLYNL